MVQPTQDPRLQQSMRLAKRLDITVVVPNLIDELALCGQFDKCLAFGQVEAEGLLTENVQAMFQRATYHLAVKARRCGDHNAVKLYLGEHLAIVRIDLDTRVFMQDVQNISRGVAHCDEINVGMGIQYRLVRQTHLAEPYEASPDHASTPNCD